MSDPHPVNRKVNLIHSLITWEAELFTETYSFNQRRSDCYCLFPIKNGKYFMFSFSALP